MGIDRDVILGWSLTNEESDMIATEDDISFDELMTKLAGAGVNIWFSNWRGEPDFIGCLVINENDNHGVSTEATIKTIKEASKLRTKIHKLTGLKLKGPPKFFFVKY